MANSELTPPPKPTPISRSFRESDIRGLGLLAAGTSALMGAAWLYNQQEQQYQQRLKTSLCEGYPRAGIMYPQNGETSTTTTVRAGVKSSNKVASSYKYDLSARAVRGQRLYMEDTYFVGPGGRFAAVFDGHGGSGVSSYLRDSLYPLAMQELKRKQWEESDEIEELVTASASAVEERSTPHYSTNSRGASVSAHVAALRGAFNQVEENVLKKRRWDSQGSTAVAVWIHETASRNNGAPPQLTLVSANVGDSRAVLSRQGKAIDLTRDHKPNEEREKARIMQKGESIEWDSLGKVHRVKSLSVSRAIGDSFAKPVVSSEVDIQLFPVVEGRDEFVLLASDGLWDVMDSQEVVSYVHERMEVELTSFMEEGIRDTEDLENFKLVLRREMSRCLAREAIRRGSGDNVTVLIVWMKK
eukprot:CAMPEP_0198147752 /NCGR_PEP_ID=MMETSP1443-20131203/37579_1 /TAXON_ID=186043 /ORGANISM="Entomoneis sp., Strain CCMP2396" /LENGTH=413 /DNA_ID=CAMNT_0043812215 /DNA_START=238 /DNA_END=1479 /DNA_ORIENTATION=-